jgi:phosphatidylserine/phosphatidylglycerophosphate/cardiolipin synthase-like enzyme
MSTSVTGLLVDETGNALSIQLKVVLKDETALHNAPLATVSTSDGSFNIPIAGDVFNSPAARQLGLYVFTMGERQVFYQQYPDDQSGDVKALGDVTIKKSELSGFVVTLGGSSVGATLPVREGNTVRPLIDGQDAWQYTQQRMDDITTTSIYVMQLAFDTPKTQGSEAASEEPEVVLEFPSTFDQSTIGKLNIPLNTRPEQLLITQSDLQVDVRVLMSTTEKLIPGLEAAGAGAAAGLVGAELNAEATVIAVAGIVGTLLILTLLNFQGVASRLKDVVLGWFDGKPGIQKYLQAYNSTVDFQAFKMPLLTWVHAKLVMINDAEVIAMGSPFHQSYWDTHDHHIFEPRRGSASDEPVPVHDVSMAVRGPAVRDQHDAFRMHWNIAEPSKSIDQLTVPAQITTAGDGEYLAALQLVRTLNAGLFDSPNDNKGETPVDKSGEKGVLEAYLRAIESAEQYIYLENQYFTNATIARALVAALNRKRPPNALFRIIVVLNVTPDAPFYPLWQWNWISQIRHDAGANAANIGFFTAWTHDPPYTVEGETPNPKPMIAANYIHTKLGFVDGKWLTVGSGNLDGLSLETTDYFTPLLSADRRDHELNFCIFNGVDNGTGGLTSKTDAIDVFRRNLWSEHLGIPADDPQLEQNGANASDWLALWKAQAEKKRLGLANAPQTIDPTNGRVLEWPSNTMGKFKLFFGRSNAERDFLAKSQVSFTELQLVNRVRPYKFLAGKWA